jgi:Zinc carboxypeptidase
MKGSRRRRAGRLVAPLVVCLFLLVVASPAFALDPPWNGEPISHGLGPTYGETWPAGSLVGEAVASRQESTGLALMPYAAVPTLLAQFQAEAAAAGVPPRMTYEVLGQSAEGRDIYGVVINAMETTAQVRDYGRWQTIRSMMLTDPVGAQALLATYGSDVKMCAYQSHIHGNEWEAVDSNMQVIRDLTVTPRGVNPTVDKILDNEIVVVLMDNNPDGRVNGTRGNPTGLDPNRDFFVQSQPEQQVAVAFMHRWLPTGFIEGHGYYTPTLIDGCTIPHNPGIEEATFQHWNVQRIEQNRADFAASGVTGVTAIQSPIRDWNETGGTSTKNYGVAAASVPGATESGNTVTITTTAANILAQGYKVVISGVPVAGYNGTFQVSSVISPTTFTYTNPTSGLADSGGGNVALPPQPNLAQTWDDWGPFYGQSYSALLGGPDGSTLEMTGSQTGTTTRIRSKTAQYLGFYSSNNFWADHKAEMMRDHLANFIRGYTAALPNPSAFDSDPVLSSRYYSDIWQNYSIRYPMAYLIPWGAGQRSDTEANNLVTWLLRNNVLVNRATSDFTWQGTTYKAGSYVVWMAQPLRGIAWNALAAGIELSGTKITSLYASPAAWSHGLCWGADVAEVPYDDATFVPTTVPVSSPSALDGGVRDGVGAPSDWYCVALKGVHEYPAIRGLLKSGIKAEMAETSFESTTGGTMPAGTLIFPASAKAALDEAGQDGGIWFERNVGVTMPPATFVNHVPKIAYLVTSVPSGQSETSCVLDSIFSYDDTGAQQSIRRLVTSSDWNYVATNDSTGPKGLNNPSISDPLADYDVIYTTLTSWPSASYPLARQRLADFFARGGGFMTQNVSSANFLTQATPSPLVAGTLTRGSSSAQGGIALVNNLGSVTSPITGPEPSTDTLFLPSTVYYYTALPTGAVVDQQYPSNIATVGTANGFVAGLWNNRNVSANDGPVLIHGDTTMDSRYMFYNTNAFSRADAQRQWLYFVQTALWSNLTDEVTLDSGPAEQTVQYSDAIQALSFSAHDANASGSAMSVSAPGLPAGLTITQTGNNGGTTPGAASWTITGDVTAPAGDYPVTLTVNDGGVRAVGTLSLTFTVTQEDAALLYNGSVVIPAGTTPVLGSQLWDSAAVGFPGLNPEPGGTIGDITKAWVHFALTDAATSSTVGAANAQVTDTATPGDGIGSASVASPFKSSGDAVWMVASSIVKDATGATPNLYYMAPVDQTGMIIFYVDTGQFATGGGTIPTGDQKSNFGFVARLNKGGQAKGQVVFQFRGTYDGADAIFMIKSTALSGLAFSGTSYPISSTLAGKCNITIVDDQNKTRFSDGNWRFTATATDVDKGSGSDAFAITIWDKNNELYRSVPATPLSGGNVTIHNPKSK